MTNDLVKRCSNLLPNISFIQSKSFYWSPINNSIHYDVGLLDNDNGKWALLHEVSHAQLHHKSYPNDAGLLKLEVDAWEAAKTTAMDMNIRIDDEHIQTCLDTYREWLYARSTCPKCALNSLQIEPTVYECINCSTRWSVTHSRFCRPYRMQSIHKKTPLEQTHTVFR